MVWIGTTLRTILRDRGKSPVRKASQIGTIALCWTASIFLTAFWLTRSAGQAGGWAIVWFLSLVVAALISHPAWYRRL